MDQGNGAKLRTIFTLRELIERREKSPADAAFGENVHVLAIPGAAMHRENQRNTMIRSQFLNIGVVEPLEVVGAAIINGPDGTNGTRGSGDNQAILARLQDIFASRRSNQSLVFRKCPIPGERQADRGGERNQQTWSHQFVRRNQAVRRGDAMARDRRVPSSASWF